MWLLLDETILRYVHFSEKKAKTNKQTKTETKKLTHFFTVIYFQM